ncbi:MAG TPA: hypothetical protein VJO13_16570 [Ktedonobacterales bacterium]|jgi:hypothetical protein|nr:hypothetical protein [Ktedonobacterales bacterium]
MPGGRERNIMRWELRVSLLREQIARLDERLARVSASSDSSSIATQREGLIAQRTELARQLDAMGPDPRAKMG